jgi:hypothetical protein
MAGAIRLRDRKVPQDGAHTPAPRNTTRDRPTGEPPWEGCPTDRGTPSGFPGPLRPDPSGPSPGNASSATRSLSARTPAAGNSGLGRVGWVSGIGTGLSGWAP